MCMICMYMLMFLKDDVRQKMLQKNDRFFATDSGTFHGFSNGFITF